MRRIWGRQKSGPLGLGQGCFIEEWCDLDLEGQIRGEMIVRQVLMQRNGVSCVQCGWPGRWAVGWSRGTVLRHHRQKPIILCTPAYNVSRIRGSFRNHVIEEQQQQKWWYQIHLFWLSYLIFIAIPSAKDSHSLFYSWEKEIPKFLIVS